MRLNKKQVEGILQEISEEDPEHRELLLTDRLRHHVGSNPDLLERLLESAWDEVFGFDPIRWDIPGYLSFYNIKDRINSIRDQGYPGWRLVQLLCIRLGLFKINGIPLNDYQNAQSEEDVLELWKQAEVRCDQGRTIHSLFLLIFIIDFYFNTSGVSENKPPMPITREILAFKLLCEGIPEKYWDGKIIPNKVRNRVRWYQIVMDYKNNQKYSCNWKIDYHEDLDRKEKMGRGVADLYVKFSKFKHCQSFNELITICWPDNILERAKPFIESEAGNKDWQAKLAFYRELELRRKA